jgi:hypothetical protein
MEGKSVLTKKNCRWYIWRNSSNTWNKIEIDTLNNLVQELCKGLKNTTSCKLRILEPGHTYSYVLLKLTHLASKISQDHDGLQSRFFSSVQDSCFALRGGVFNHSFSSYYIFLKDKERFYYSF